MGAETDDSKSDQKPELDLVAVIDSQLDVINYVADVDNSLYETALDDKIKVTTKAFSVILKAQAKLLKII
jgi:hypothetical protein